MKVWLLDIDKCVKLNGLSPVTNPIMFDKGNIPTADGLFSTEIFGISVTDRRRNFAYIDLKRIFINPKVYITLKRLNKNFEDIIYGTKKYIIDSNGILVQDDDKGQTGIDFLYKNWEKIKFEKNASIARSTRIDVITMNNKDSIFCSTFLVIPAFYRDVNLQSRNGSVNINEINDMYSKIIRNVKMIEDSLNFDFMINSLIGKTQDLLLELYNVCKDKMDGKDGYLRKFMMGKSIDYGCRVVITGSAYDSYDEKDQLVDYRHTGIPLYYCCSIFTPFIIWYLKRFFKSRFENFENGYPVEVNGMKTTVKLHNPSSYFNDEYISEKLQRFISTPSSRFDPIEVPVLPEELKRINKDKITVSLVGYRSMTTTMDKQENQITRPMTWTDLLYLACFDVTQDKFVLITRYPVLDYFGIYPSKVSILSTQQTMSMVINDQLYTHYPVIPQNVKPDDIEYLFKDTVNICALYLPALGGDHDGDQVTVKGVFTQEANARLEELTTSKQYILDISGNNVRTIGNEGIQTLYTLTKFKK